MTFKENMRRSWEIIRAYWRQGLHELGSVFYGPGTAAQHPEYGMLGTRPPGLVTDGLRPGRDNSTAKDDYSPSILDERLIQAERSDLGREMEPREPERD